MYDVVVRADIIDGYSEILDKSFKSCAFSDFSEPNDYLCSFYNHHEVDYLQKVIEHNKQNDEEEFRTICCLDCFNFLLFRRKYLS